MNRRVRKAWDRHEVQRGATRLHRVLMAALLLLVVVRLVVPALRVDNFGIVADAEGGGWSSDFPAHLTFAKAFWHGKAGYDVASHLRITSERCRRRVKHALPFGYSPTMLWLLGPFCLLPDAWAYVLWTLLGVAAAWWMSGPPKSIWLVAAFFTPTAFACLKLGQTALLTTAGLLFLMERDLQGHRRSGSPGGVRSDWLDAGVLWALTAKPPLALTAGVVLVAQRRWRVVGQAAALSVVSTALLTPALGLNWVGEYVHLLTHYDLQSADPAYVWSLAPETMGNMRALLHVTLGVGDSAASRLSGSVWLLALFGILTGALWRKLPVEAAWGSAVLAYLVFCPHVTSTEELQLVVMLALFTQPPVTKVARWGAVGLVLGILYLAPGIGYQGLLRIPVLCTGKILLAALVWVQWLHARPAGHQPPLPAV